VVNFIDANGNDLTVVTNLGTNYEFTFNLAAGATQAVRVTPGATFLQGHVQVLYPEFTSPVRGSEVYRYESNGVVLVEVGMPQQEMGDHFSFPVSINFSQRVATAIALTNPVNADQTFVVNLINSDGTLAATKTVPLGAFSHAAGYIDEAWMFPQLHEATFTGSISVSSQWGAGVLTLRQDKDSFGAVATDGGPMLLPSFLVTNAFNTDADGTAGGANDFIEDAQAITLPVRVSGSIGYPFFSEDEPEDWDYYTFNGVEGDILTIVCDTTLLGVTSYLDPIVRVWDDTGSEVDIAYNDQNGLAPGLYPLNDSFIQMELPYTGTYYITVYDYWTDVGDTTSYKYHLHVKTR